MTRAATALRVLSAGACQALFKQVTAPWPDLPSQAVFGPVGGLTQKLRAGESADVLLSSRVAIDALSAEGRILPDSIQTVGWVATAAAVPAGTSGAALAAAPDAFSFVRQLGNFAHIYMPDTALATAGRRVLGLLQATGAAETLAARLHIEPNGAAAVSRMLSDGHRSAVAFAQATEIAATPGALRVCGLPDGHELMTEYCVALVRTDPPHPYAKTFMDRFRSQLNPMLLERLGFSIVINDQDPDK